MDKFIRDGGEYRQYFNYFNNATLFDPIKMKYKTVAGLSDLVDQLSNFELRELDSEFLQVTKKDIF